MAIGMSDQVKIVRKKVSVTFTFYEDGTAEISGECDFCKQFPCCHVNPEGEFYWPSGKIHVSVHSMLRLNPEGRKNLLKQKKAPIEAEPPAQFKVQLPAISLKTAKTLKQNLLLIKEKHLGWRLWEPDRLDELLRALKYVEGFEGARSNKPG